jgi:hypothetical protein
MAVRQIRATGSPEDIRQLVEAVNLLAAGFNEIKTDYNAVLAKLDADTGLDASDYVSTSAIAATVDTVTVGY